jgi:hypothetical protein
MASNEIENLGSAVTVENVKKNAASRALNRRHFMAALGMTGAAAGAGLMSGCSTSNAVVATTAGVAQTNGLNFLLNLKFLEATFYSYLTTGADISASTGVSLQNSGAITGAPAALTVGGSITQQTVDLLNELYFDEWNHLALLQGLLGSAVVPRPAINLAAFGAITPTNALSIARVLEDVAVTAFAGVAASLTNSNLTYAGQILGSESFHAGAIRLLSIQNPTIAAYIAADSNDVAPVDPGSAATAAAGPAGNGAFFATYGTAAAGTTAGFAYSRTTSQVLAVLYGSAGSPAASGKASGGFFPSGVNGSINTI